MAARHLVYAPAVVLMVSRRRFTSLILVTLTAVAGLTETPSAQRAAVTGWLQTAMRQAPANAHHVVWVYFRDKGPGAGERRSPVKVLSARTIARRALRARATGISASDDAALEPAYVQQVAARVVRVRHQLRWLNAISVEATSAQIESLTTLPFVARVDIVRRYRRAAQEPFAQASPRIGGLASGGPSRARATQLNYGVSGSQLAQIRVPELHDRGLTGAGVVVAVFDSGFANLQHEAFRRTSIVAERDFVHGADDVRGTTARHGTATLSVLGGFRDGVLIGVAHDATFLLAVTEDETSETPVEEDNWAAAAEWAEALGADVISSSLGYLEFDLPFTSYTDRDLDGRTAVTTIAAEMATARGVVVVNSAGNGGFHPDRNTLIAPADGAHVLAVGAVDRVGMRAEFSSVGPTADGRVKPDVAALGVAALAASTGSPNAYAFVSGTSFSCPLTAGVVALLLQAHPDYTVDQVIVALRSTASQAQAPDNLLGWGIVDAVQAVDVQIAPDVDATRPQRMELSVLAP